ncbi:Helix-loop-helix DNA-binding domain [Brachionus plicatilis]|uniref:Helix-loop-helix DNA-binding domain n=1 Tax=Brachionus plicatilis TaxID=10195 RepID=A0A3M7S8W1_BRAPC|nr:Helix-loop-helix DNA-binding domain [Brachionus plicatilis]
MAQFNYNWTTSPYQNSPSNINANYFYNNSLINNVYHEINPFMPLNGSYVATPTSDNRTFSSGYGSENTSFNSPPVMKLNYALSPSNLPNQLPNVSSDSKSRDHSGKRSRDQHEKPKNKKSKQSKKSAEEYEELDYENFDFSLNGSQLDSQSNMERKKRILTRSQRIAANMRERKRMCIMNDCYVNLREALPITTGRKRRKMSRLDIVVGAMEYIAYLEQLLERDYLLQKQIRYHYLHVPFIAAHSVACLSKKINFYLFIIYLHLKRDPKRIYLTILVTRRFLGDLIEITYEIQLTRVVNVWNKLDKFIFSSNSFSVRSNPEKYWPNGAHARTENK